MSPPPEVEDVAARPAVPVAPLALAATAWVGSLLAAPVPGPVVVGVVVGAVIGLRQWWRWCLVVFVVTSALAARAITGLAVDVEGPVAGTATLVTDPELVPDGRVRAEVRLAGRRYLGEARASQAIGVLTPLLAGEQVVLSGTLAPFGSASAWARSRHLAGRLRIERVDAVVGAAPHARAANAVRRVLASGASSLPAGHQALLAGLTLGDDRAQPPGLAADFRAAGLTHLLAVSGQNLVFVLLVLGPLTSRLSLWPRLVCSVAVVGSFAFLTRFEPSVVRAGAVAVVALTARTIGRPSGGLTHLALAVAAVLVVDPLLSRSIGFRLSVAACVGVLVLAPALVRRIPGPRWIAEGLGVTVGAQLAVAPVLVPTFGPMPLAALPANVVAAPIAGALMVWGITAGLVAGIVGEPVAWLLHRPTALGCWALDEIAAVGARLPLGQVDLRHLAVMAVAWWCWGRRRVLTTVAVGLVALALVTPAMHTTVDGPVVVAAGWAAEVWVDGPVAVVVLEPGASALEVVAVLRTRRATRIGLLVVTSTRPSLAGVAADIAERVPVAASLTPADARTGSTTRVGGVEVVVERAAPTLRVRVGPARRAGDGSTVRPGAAADGG